MQLHVNATEITTVLLNAPFERMIIFMIFILTLVFLLT